MRLPRPLHDAHLLQTFRIIDGTCIPDYGQVHQAGLKITPSAGYKPGISSLSPMRVLASFLATKATRASPTSGKIFPSQLNDTRCPCSGQSPTPCTRTFLLTPAPRSSSHSSDSSPPIFPSTSSVRLKLSGTRAYYSQEGLAHGARPRQPLYGSRRLSIKGKRLVSSIWVSRPSFSVAISHTI